MRIVERLGHRELRWSVDVALLLILHNIEVRLSLDIVRLIACRQASSGVEVEL